MIYMCDNMRMDLFTISTSRFFALQQHQEEPLTSAKIQGQQRQKPVTSTFAFPHCIKTIFAKMKRRPSVKTFFTTRS